MSCLKGAVTFIPFKFNILKAGLIDMIKYKDQCYDGSGKESIAAWDYLLDRCNLFKNLRWDDYKNVKFALKKIQSIRLKEIIDAPVNQAFLETFTATKKGTKGMFRYILPEKDISKEAGNIIYYKVLLFLKHSRDRILEYLHRNGKMTFKDALVYATELIKNDTDQEHGVISKIQSKYKHYLIDEFQDDDLIQSELFFRITSPTIHKEWKEVEKAYFPGYIFVETDDPKELFKQLSYVPSFTKLLGRAGYTDFFLPLSKEEERVLDILCSKHSDRVTKLSSVMIKEGMKIQVLDGPLIGLETTIKKVNLHKRTVTIPVNIAGRPGEVELGIDIVSEMF